MAVFLPSRNLMIYVKLTDLHPRRTMSINRESLNPVLSRPLRLSLAPTICPEDGRLLIRQIQWTQPQTARGVLLTNHTSKTTAVWAFSFSSWTIQHQQTTVTLSSRRIFFPYSRSWFTRIPSRAPVIAPQIMAKLVIPNTVFLLNPVTVPKLWRILLPRPG